MVGISYKKLFKPVVLSALLPLLLLSMHFCSCTAQVKAWWIMSIFVVAFMGYVLVFKQGGSWLKMLGFASLALSVLTVGLIDDGAFLLPVLTLLYVFIWL